MVERRWAARGLRETPNGWPVSLLRGLRMGRIGCGSDGEELADAVVARRLRRVVCSLDGASCAGRLYERRIAGARKSRYSGREAADAMLYERSAVLDGFAPRAARRHSVHTVDAEAMVNGWQEMVARPELKVWHDGEDENDDQPQRRRRRSF